MGRRPERTAGLVPTPVGAKRPSLAVVIAARAIAMSPGAEGLVRSKTQPRAMVKAMLRPLVKLCLTATIQAAQWARGTGRWEATERWRVRVMRR